MELITEQGMKRPREPDQTSEKKKKKKRKKKKPKTNPQ